jgi:hypothetical protein
LPIGKPPLIHAAISVSFSKVKRAGSRTRGAGPSSSGSGQFVNEISMVHTVNRINMYVLIREFLSRAINASLVFCQVKKAFIFLAKCINLKYI